MPTWLEVALMIALPIFCIGVLIVGLAVVWNRSDRRVLTRTNKVVALAVAAVIVIVFSVWVGLLIYVIDEDERGDCRDEGRAYDVAWQYSNRTCRLRDPATGWYLRTADWRERNVDPATRWSR